MKLFLHFIIFSFISSSVFGLSYNFLNSTQTRQEAVKILKNAGLSSRNIKAWLAMVKNYNSKIALINSTKQGWQQTNQIDVFSSNMINGGKYYVNCRISDFILIYDKISANKCYRDFSRWSYFKREIKVLKNNPFLSINEKEMTAYKSLFLPISIPQSELNQSLFDNTLKLLKTWWKKEGLTFPKNQNIKIVQVFQIHPQYKTAFSDHVGLMIKSKKQNYFLEKRSPGDPFMISKIKNFNELGKYLFDGLKNEKKTGVMIIANDKIIWKKLLAKNK